MNKFTITFALLGICSTGFSQSNTLAGGGEATGSGGSVSYSVGQVDYINSSGTGGSVNQGVQQPYELFVAGISEGGLISLNMYPNPTSDQLIIEIDETLKDLSFDLTDMNGKVLISQTIKDKETLLNLKEFASGSYHLVVQHENEIIESFKIIKN